MKPIVIIAAGLVAGIGGGTAVTALKVKGQVEAEMAARADSLAVLAAEAEHTTEGGAPDGSGELPLDGEAADVDGQGHGEEGEVDDAQHSTEAPDPDAPVDGDTDTPPAPGTEADAAPIPAATPPATNGTTPPVTNPTTPATPPAGRAVTAEGARRMAKIFAAMRAEDATAVLIELENEEVAAILGELSDRQAAAILGNFAADRAAILGRMMLGGTV